MRQNVSVFTSALLTWIAGFVDAVGFLSLGRIYTANMSGNSVAIGIQWAAQNWPETFRRICPVAAYVIGLVVCRALIEYGARKRITRIASLAFLIESALLMPALLAQPSGVRLIGLVYIGLLSLAMGVQNGALTRFSSLTIHTGFVTGALVKFAEEATKYFTWVFDSLRAPGGSLRKVLTQSFSQKPLQIAFWLAAIWIAYVVGACCGALGQHVFQLRALVAPIAALLLSTAIDLRWPLAVAEEQAQAKLTT